MSVGRLEAFSDGVLAVVITILVLELKVESGAPLGEQLSRQWPVWLAYVVSFVIVGVIWVQHHALFALASRVDRPVLYVNLVLLFAVSLVPFTASSVGAFLRGDRADARLAVQLYGASMELMAVAFTVILWLLLSRGALAVDVPRERAHAALRRFGVGIAVYPALMLVAFLSPVAALLGYAVVVVLYAAERTPVAARAEVSRG